jgi:hypothetical protein
VGSWEFAKVHLDAGWGSRAVEGGGREWSANHPKICLGPPQILQAKRTRGWDAAATVQREEKEVAG